MFFLFFLFFFNVGPIDIFFDPIYGLYFSHQRTYYKLQSFTFLSKLGDVTESYTDFLREIDSTMPQAGIDPPAQSHASYEASALPQVTTAGCSAGTL